MSRCYYRRKLAISLVRSQLKDAANLQGATITLSGAASQTATSTANGGYSFVSLAKGSDFTVTPQLDKNHLNGVSTFDLVLIQKHILNVQALNSPYKMIAADVNNSKSITTLDLIALRKLILNIDQTFQNNTSWRFVDAAYKFPNASNPWAATFPEVVSINDLTADTDVPALSPSKWVTLTQVQL